MDSLRVEQVCTDEKFKPLLINFQNGYTTDAFDSVDSQVFENVDNLKKFIAFELDGLVYAGEEINENIGKNVLVVRNKKTGKVRVIEAGEAEVSAKVKFDFNTSQLLHTSNLELSRKFGSKKQKQQMEQQEKLKVNVQTVVEQMQNVTDSITEDKLDLSIYNKNDSDDFYIPLIDRKADRAENVYDINKILTEEEFDKIYSELEDKDYKSDLTQWVKDVVADAKLSEKQTVLAVYASSLFKLFLTNAREISKKGFDTCPISPTLNQIILNNFTSVLNGRRTRSTPLKDKALCHAIVFMLLINNLKFNLENLCKEAKLTQNTISLKVRVTCASVVTNGNKKIVQLKLPLNTKSGFRRRSAKF